MEIYPGIHLTISGVPRAMNCEASALLPRAKRSLATARTGNIIHDFLEDSLNLGRDAALCNMPLEHRAAAEAIDISALPAGEPGSYSAEVVVAYNILTGEARILEGVKDRAYPVLEGEGWLIGTEDVVGLTDDAVITLDYKTGWGDLTRAGKHNGVRTYGLAFARAFGRSRAIVGLIRGFMDGGDPWFDVFEMDAIELDAQEYELQMLYRRLVEAKKRFDAGEWDGATATGDHCKFCDGFPYCPAQQILARMVIRAGEGDISPIAPNACGKIAEVGSHLNEVNALAFYQSIQKAKAVVLALEEILDVYARGTPIPLGDGNVYGPRPWPIEKIDPNLARDVIVHGLQEEDPGTHETVVWCQPYGAAVYDASVSTETKLKKGDLELALKEWAKQHPGSKWSKEKEALLEALRRAGASRVTYTYPVGKFKAKSLPAGADSKKS